MDIRGTFGLFGSLALIIGVFSPVISAPLIENITYYRNGSEFGIAVLVIAGISLLVTFSRMYRVLPLLGAGALGVVGYTFINVQRKFSDARSQVSEGIGEGALRDLANSAIDTVQMQWGWAVLAVGAVLLLTTALGRKAG